MDIEYHVNARIDPAQLGSLFSQQPRTCGRSAGGMAKMMKQTSLAWECITHTWNGRERMSDIHRLDTNWEGGYQ